MKIVLREWWRDKVACAMMAFWLLLSMLYAVLDARMVIQISRSVEQPQNWKQNLMMIVIIGAINMMIGTALGWLRPMSIHHCFSTLNNNFADKVLDADVSMFTEYSCAYINSMSEYIWKITEAGKNITRFVYNIGNLIVMLVSIYIVGGWVVIPVIVINGLGAILCKYLFHQFDVLDQKADAIKRKRNQEIENIVNGFAEVRSFHTQEYHRGIIRKYNDDIYAGRAERSQIQMVTNASMEIVEILGLIAIIVYSIYSMGHGMITPAAAMSLVMYVSRLTSPIGQMMDFVDSISDETARASSYDKIISYRPPMPDGKIKMDSFDEEIELKNVCFGYQNSSDVLRNISMRFPKGKKIGICGTTGAGKSTLFKLLNRFYPTGSGEILIDGININAITKESYFKHIGSVHQDNTIFPGTIRENILYGNPNTTEYEMIMACKNAKIYDFIDSQKDKFETVIGPRGITLSGGQKQRIALARLFLTNPDVILLDEATSALDNKSETFIQEAIDALPGKTIITIAHRLSTIRNSDIIYVIGNHGVVEYGTHEYLMARGGVYASMNK